MAWIRIEVGASRHGHGRQLKVNGSHVVLGRDEGCTVRVEDDQVSRRHVELAVTDRGWVVRDLGSVNGTLLNGKRVGTAELRPRDVLRLGETGPKVHVVDFEPAAAEEHDLEATRFLRVRGPEAGQPVPVELGAAVPVRRRGETAAPWLLLLGLLAGVFTGLEAWPRGFPFEEVGAPAVWAARLTGAVAPALLEERAAWLVAVALGAYLGIWGFGLQRAARRWPLLMVLALVHAAAYFALPKLGG